MNYCRYCFTHPEDTDTPQNPSINKGGVQLGMRGITKLGSSERSTLLFFFSFLSLDEWLSSLVLRLNVM
ncbi:hypothetical protein ACSQ67_022111 [Phaseolus vulgaris]